MLNATIRINSIDYEKTLQHIFPVVSEKVKALNSKKMIIRLFQQLDDAALPVVIGLAYRLPEATKNELLIRGLNAYAPVLMVKLNDELHKDKWGRCFTVGTFSVTQSDGIFLEIDQIEVDYQELLSNEEVSSTVSMKFSDAVGDRFGSGRLSRAVKAVAGAAGVAGTAFATAVAPNTSERKALDYLAREDNKKRIIDFLKKNMTKYGIQIDVDDIQIMQVENSANDVVEITKPFTLTEEMEDDIICALSGYLRSNVTEGLTVI